MPQALHEQLSGILRSRILSGDVGPGTALPTEHQLMQIYEVSRSVVRQAMQVLEWEGLVTRNPGRGTFVREQSKSPISTYAGWSLGSLDELLAFGLQTRLTVLGKNEVAADAQVSAALEISEGETVFELRGVRSGADGIFSYQRNFFLRDIGRVIDSADLTQGSLLDVMQACVKINLVQASQVVTAVAADKTAAKFLGVDVGAPLLSIERMFISEERGPVEYGIMLYRPDRYRYISKLTRTQEHNSAAPGSNTDALHKRRRLALNAL